MADITVPGPISGKGYRVRIAGDTPTMDEQLKIDSFISQREQEFRSQYEKKIGPLDYENSGAILEGAGEFGKGLIRGGVGLVESAGLGIAARLPESWEDPARELIRSGAYAVKPQADIGREGSVAGTFGEAAGSFAPLAGAALLSGPVGWGTAATLAIGAGSGEASERARAAGATEEERNKASLIGAAIGAFDLAPLPVLRTLPSGMKASIATRITRALATGGAEAAQEAATEIAQNLVSQGIYNPEQDVFEGVGGAAGYGGGVGGMTQVLLDMFVRKRGPSAKAPAPAETPPAAAPVAPAAPAAQTKSVEELADEVAGEDAEEEPGLFQMPRANLAAPVLADSPDFANLTTLRQEQELAYAAGLKFSPSLPADIMRLAAEGKTYAEIAQKLGKTINNLTKGETNPGVRAKIRNEFVSKLMSRIGIPTDPKSPEFASWAAAYKAAPKPARKTVEKVDLPKPVIDALAAKTEKAVENATSPEVVKEIKELASTKPTAVVAEKPEATPPVPAAPLMPLFTPELVMGELGFSKGSSVAKAAANDATVAGKPLDDPAVKAKLQSLLTNALVTPEKKARIKALMAPTPAPEAAPTPAPEAAPTPTSEPEAAPAPAPEAAPAPVPEATTLKAASATPPEGRAESAPFVPNPAPIEYIPMTGASPGAAGGPPVQPVAEPPRVTQNRLDRIAEGTTLPRIKTQPREGAEIEAPEVPKRRLAVPQNENEIKAAQRDMAAISRIKDSVDNRELGDKLAEKVRSGLTEADIEFLGENVSLTPDVTNSGDKTNILRLLGRGGADTAEAKAAKRFFSKFTNPTEALEEIGAQSIVAQKQIQSANDRPEAVAFYAGMGQNAAVKAQEWVEENLSSAAQKVVAAAREDAHNAMTRIIVRGEKGHDPVTLDRQRAEELAKIMDGVIAGDPRLKTEEGMAALRMQAIQAVAEANEAAKRAASQELASKATAIPDRLKAAPAKKVDVVAAHGKTKFELWLDTNYSKAEQAEMTKVEREELYDGWAFSIKQGYALRTDAATALDRPLLPSMKRMLMNGKLGSALNAVSANASTSGVARIARALAKNIGTTKVELVDGLTNYDGDPVSGVFEPEENTIYIDVNTGLNVHTLMHEATHAVVSHVIAKPGHPLTKQLQRLLSDVRPRLGSVYGTSNLQEFAAELLSNPEFQGRLAQLKERGRKINALDRAMNALRNLVRRLIGLPHTPIGTALTRGDEIINGMMSPAPEYRHAGALYSAHDKGLDAKIMANAVGNAPTATQERLQQISNLVADRSIDAGRGSMWLAREAILRLTPLHYLVKVAEPHFPMAPKLHDLVNAASGELARVRDSSQALSAAIGSWATKNPQLVDRFNNLVNYSTLYQVNPEITADEAMRKYGLEERRMDDWRRVKADWNAVGASGQAEYKRLRNTFKTLHAELEKALELRLEATIPDEKIRAAVRSDLYMDIMKHAQLEPYFPLGRHGDHWLSYNAIDPRSGELQFFVEAFESSAERDRYIRELQADPELGAANFRKMPRRADVDFTQAPSASFMGKMNSKLKSRGVDDKVVQLISEIYLDTIPETSFLQSFRQRKGTLGFNRDAIRVGAERAAGLGRNIVQLKYGSQLSAFKSELNQRANELVDAQVYTPGVQQVREQLDAFADFAARPDRHWAARIATTFTFNMTLGFNASTALLNLFQMPMVTLPTLGGRYGWKSSTKAIGEAMRHLTGSGHTREIEVYNPDGTGMVKQRVNAAPSLENYDFSDPNLPERVRRLKHLVEIGKDNGQFNRSIAYDILDMDSRLPSDSKVKVALDRAQAASGWMLHHSERINREATLAAAYNLEVDRIEAKEKRKATEAEMRDAAKQAIYLTEMTNGGTAAASTPRIAHSGLGQVAFMYKRYGVSMYALLFDTAKRALKDTSPEGRREAMRQIAGIAGMTGLLSGVAGMPMYGAIAAVFNLAADDEDRDFNTWTREMVGDGVYRGAVNSVLGINVASRIELSNLLFRESQIEREQSALWTLIEQLGGPAIGTFLNMERGKDLIAEGRIYDGTMALMPAPVRYLMKSGKFATEGAVTRDGDTIVDDIHPGHLLSQALGFAPAEYAQQQEINAARKKFEKAVVERRSNLSDKYAAAIREGNREALREVLQMIKEFNADHPYWPLTADSLQRSIAARKRTDTRTVNGVSFNPRLLDAAKEFASDYNG